MLSDPASFNVTKGKEKKWNFSACIFVFSFEAKEGLTIIGGFMLGSESFACYIPKKWLMKIIVSNILFISSTNYNSLHRLLPWEATNWQKEGYQLMGFWVVIINIYIKCNPIIDLQVAAKFRSWNDNCGLG